MSPPSSPPTLGGLQTFERRDAPDLFSGSASPFRTFGVLSAGLSTVGDAFQSLTQVFQASPLAPETSSCLHFDPRIKAGLLASYPVDLLFVDTGTRKMAKLEKQREELWELAVQKVAASKKAPMAVCESWVDSSASWEGGPASKARGSRWLGLGYTSRVFVLSATEFGGSVSQGRLLVVRYRPDAFPGGEFHWPARDPSGVRPMSNLLLPRGLLRKDPHFSRASCSPRGCFPVASADPMPWSDRHLLSVETDDTVRPLLPVELGRALGVSKVSFCPLTELSQAAASRLLFRTTSVFHWEFVSGALSSLASSHTSFPPPASRPPGVAPSVDLPPAPRDPPLPFDWEMRDISAGKPWWCDRVATLKAAASHYPPSESKTIIREGLEMLNVHRRNYTDGKPTPQRLQILWWEFPREHWDELRNGCSMNFLRPPPPRDTPNNPMDEIATRVASEFIDELLEIGAMGPLPPGVDPWVIAPLFAIPKEGQPGQFRVIADFRSGTQNQSCGADPVFLNRPTHILEQLYCGGWSAVVDASKYFYQFPTNKAEHPYLCLRHPLTGIVYTYYGLPMGASNSPALGGRFGLAFVRRVLRRVNGPPSAESSDGAPRSRKVRNNTWWASFTKTGEYDPKLGHGYLLSRVDGGPPVHIWVHVDDFLIHASTEAECHRALALFLDVSVEHGLLCHPGKLQPPSQRQKYVGFIFDTTGVPTLLIPDLKRDRAVAMIRYVRNRPLSHQFSHLALSVVAGTLESLSDATPFKMGHSRLRGMYELIHRGEDTFGLASYLRKSPVCGDTRSDLGWWEETLLSNPGCRAYGHRAHVLVPTWGDGSGTGTGGTIQLPGTSRLIMWRGVWEPHVFRFTSNKKELDTLRLTLAQILDDVQSGHCASLDGTTLFYFTDNEVTYYICAAGSSRIPPLHSLILEIRRLQILLGVFLNTVHVPGKVMITQGTDSLSRGVWVSPLHDRANPDHLNGMVFSPVSFDPSLVDHIIQSHSQVVPPDGIRPWRHQPWDSPWETESLFDTLTVWFPPPEMARQAIIFQLLAFCERPLTTSAIFVIPRVLVGCWRGLSSYLTELAVIKEHDWTFSPPRLLPQIPVWVIYLAPHTRSLPLLAPGRLDPAPSLPYEWWHRQQADFMRSL